MDFTTYLESWLQARTTCLAAPYGSEEENAAMRALEMEARRLDDYLEREIDTRAQYLINNPEA